MRTPKAYFITFRTYGSWLRGDRRGWTDRRNNVPDTPHLEPDDALAGKDLQRLKHPPVTLSSVARRVVEEAVRDECAHHGWPLLALNVLATHVHLVAESDRKPEYVMTTLKAAATGRMRAAGIFDPDTKVWARHGSTVYLWSEYSVADACDYVLFRQGHHTASGE